MSFSTTDISIIYILSVYVYTLNIYLKTYLYTHVIQETNFRKVNKTIFFMNCWDLVWLLDSGAQEEAFYTSKCFTFSIFMGVKIYHTASAAPLAMYVTNPCPRALIHSYVT